MVHRLYDLCYLLHFLCPSQRKPSPEGGKPEWQVILYQGQLPSLIFPPSQKALPQNLKLFVAVLQGGEGQPDGSLASMKHSGKSFLYWGKWSPTAHEIAGSGCSEQVLPETVLKTDASSVSWYSKLLVKLRHSCLICLVILMFEFSSPRETAYYNFWDCTDNSQLCFHVTISYIFLHKKGREESTKPTYVRG